MATNYVDTWGKCLHVIQTEVSEATFETWFKPIRPVKLQENVLTVEVPSDFFCTFLEDHYLQPIKLAIVQTLGPKGMLEYQIPNHEKPPGMERPKGGYSHHAHSSSPAINTEIPKGRMGPNPFAIPGMKNFELDPNLNTSFTFDTMVEGECNRLARAASFAVAHKPGVTAYNPLFLFSQVGLGKTHLLQAIGNYVRQENPRKSVLYVSAEQFTNQFVDNVKRNTIGDFMNFYQNIDLLLVDDIQSLAGKERTQDNFFHIFNHLRQNNRQIVLASDRPPMDMQGMEERLLSRFRWGLTAELKSPAFDTRKAILIKKMDSSDVVLPDPVVDFLAYNMTTNVRDLEGALINLMAQSTLNNREMDVDLARQVVSSYKQSVVRELTIEGIQRTVSDAFDVTVDAMKSSVRRRPIVQARQVAMFFAKEFTQSSLALIGQHFGNRDHSTVIHALQTVKDLMETDREFSKKVQEIQQSLQRESGR